MAMATGPTKSSAMTSTGLDGSAAGVAHMRSIIAVANSLVLTLVAPSIWRSKS